MATWFDYFVLLVTLCIIAGLVFTYFLAKKVLPGAFESAKDSLKKQGVDVSRQGLSVKTDKRFDREQYLDATQRGFIKAFNASSAGNRPGSGSVDEASQGKRGLFGKRAHTVEK
ncbi:hypothetical protein LXA43DRAFT_208310 [Ganoderma leucocontextum]|nr:hypothetical protein LXA43DRAFT_208310 [Ganoderma leucocontextum]